METAEKYFARIPDGHENAMKRPYKPSVDRQLRNMIEKANKNGDCIINIGDGIFRPIPGNVEDERQLKIYLGKELHRARSIQLKRLTMRTTFEGWKNEALFNDFRQAGQPE